MSRTHSVARGALLLGAAAVVTACHSDATVLGPAVTNDIFASYVALGNSITAGWQSGGINDSTQRQSFAFLLAQQMGTRFAYPSFSKPGCPPPIGSFVSQKTIDSLAPLPAAAPCAFRSSTSNTDVLNNVAVPYAYGADVNLVGSAIIPTSLPTLILGGLTQVTAALRADPTFATVWLGNNEVLLPASLGQLAAAGYPPLIPASVFIPGYGKGIDSLLTAPRLKHGILIGVVNVTNLPRFFSADSLALNPVRKADFDFITGKTNTIVGCGASGDLISGELIAQIRKGALPPIVSCVKNVPQPPLGDIFILDPQEIAAIQGTTAQYNAYIKAKADSIGFAYVDPNPALLALRQSGSTAPIAMFPNLRSATNPYGTYISLDGAHPSARGQAAIANVVIDAINSKYGTTLAKVAIP